MILRGNALVVCLAIAAAAARLSLQLLTPPRVGLANNGDFERIMGWVGLRSFTDRYEDKYFSFVQPRFEMVRPVRDRDGYLSSEILLAGAARVAAQASGSTAFDLRLLGVLHALLLLAAIGALVFACGDLPPPAQWTAAAALVFFFADAGYAAPLNSLYTQTASFLFLLLTAAAAAQAIRRGRLAEPLLAAYFVCATLFLCSKPQEAVHAPLLALFGLALAGPAAGCSRRRAARWCAFGLVVLAISYFVLAPQRLRQQSLYNLVFFELLPHSPEPQRDLAELGLDPRWVRFSGTTAYSPDSAFSDPAFRDELTARTGYGAVARFYARKPDRLLSAVRRAGADALTLRPEDLGNFEKSAGFPPGSRSERHSAWSRLRKRAAPFAGPALGALLAGNLVFAAAGYRRASWREKRVREGVVLLCVMAAAAFLIAVGGDGHMELARHLFVFHALCDLLLAADLTWLARALTLRIVHRP